MHVGVDYPSYMMRLHAHPSESPQSLGSLLGGSNRSDSSAIYVSNGNLSCDSSISTCASIFPRVPYSALPPGKRGCTWCAESELLACTLLKKRGKTFSGIYPAIIKFIILYFNCFVSECAICLWIFQIRVYISFTPVRYYIPILSMPTVSKIEADVETN